MHNSLQGVSNRSAEAQALSRRFTMGDDTVSLSDTMVAMQKLLAPVLQDMQRDLQEQAAAKDTVPAK